MSDSIISSRSHIRFPQYDEAVGVKLSSENRRVLFADDPETQSYLRATGRNANWRDELAYDYSNVVDDFQISNMSFPKNESYDTNEKLSLRSREKNEQTAVSRRSKFTKDNLLKKEDRRDIQQTMIYRDGKGDLFNQSARKAFEDDARHTTSNENSYRSSFESRKPVTKETNERKYFEEDWSRSGTRRNENKVNRQANTDIKNMQNWNPRKSFDTSRNKENPRGAARDSLHATDHRMSDKYQGRSYFVPKYIPASMIHEESKSNVSNQELRKSMQKKWSTYYYLDTREENEAAFQAKERASDSVVREFEEQKKQAEKYETRRKVQEPITQQLGLFKQDERNDSPAISRRELREARKKGLTPYEMKQQSSEEVDMKEKNRKPRLEKSLSGIMEEENYRFDEQHFLKKDE